MKKIIITESQLFKIQEILNVPQVQYIEDNFSIPINNSDREFNVTIEAIYIEEDEGMEQGGISKTITGFRPKEGTFNPVFSEIIEKWINRNSNKLSKHFYNIIENQPINESKKKIIITENQLKTIINSTKKN